MTDILCRQNLGFQRLPDQNTYHYARALEVFCFGNVSPSHGMPRKWPRYKAAFRGLRLYVILPTV